MTTRERFEAWVKSDSGFHLDFYYVAWAAYQAGAAAPEIAGDSRRHVICVCPACARTKQEPNVARAPEGWQLVPKEPIPEMIKSGRISDPLGCDVEDEDADTVYRGVWFGMLAAAPEPKP